MAPAMKGKTVTVHFLLYNTSNEGFIKDKPNFAREVQLRPPEKSDWKLAAVKVTCHRNKYVQATSTNGKIYTL